MEYFDPFAFLFWQTTGLAVACGGIVGLERQLRGKVAGVRTSILICLSTTIFVHLGVSLVDAEAAPHACSAKSSRVSASSVPA